AKRTLNKLDTLDPGNEEDSILKHAGGVELAYTDEQMRALKRRHGFAQAWRVESELTGPSRTKEPCRSLGTSDLAGALHTPPDGLVHSVRASTAQAQRAIAHGATFHSYTQVTDLVIDNSAVTGVRVVDALSGDNERVIEADIGIAAGGIWGPTIGKWFGK